MKRAAVFFLGFFIVCLPLLDAQSGKKPLTLEDVIHPTRVAAAGITALSWRPGGKQLTFLRPSWQGKEGASALCAYDWESHTETVLFNPLDRKEKLDLNSYQWSPRGDAILFEGENDLWLLDPQTGTTAPADPGWRGERGPGVFSGG